VGHQSRAEALVRRVGFETSARVRAAVATLNAGRRRPGSVDRGVQALDELLDRAQPVVVSRNGVAATCGPWWVDSLDVADGDTYEIAFVADNPGIWMDHCHNLKHAADGLVAHLAYAGVTEPYRVGGSRENAPE
jgi:hypothetical protein